MEKLDPIVLNSLFQITQISKSAALALTLIYQGDGHDPDEERLSLIEAVNIARVDEQFQQSICGVVEGAHDFDRIHNLTTFATAKTLVNLSMLREF